MGYTPVFSDIYMGTLYGRWPAAAVWASLLPLLDKNGVIDISMQAICGMTGWPLDLLQQGISQLMEADPHSRTTDSDGKRLVLIDPARPWGWKAVNHGKYRERARKQQWDAERTASGRDAERKRVGRAVPTCPDVSRRSPLSDTDTDSNTDDEEKREPLRASRSARATRLPEDFVLTEERRGFASKEGLDPDRTFANFTDYWRAASGAKARKVDWNATWQVWCRNDRGSSANGHAKPSRRLTRYEELVGVEDVIVGDP